MDILGHAVAKIAESIGERLEQRKQRKKPETCKKLFCKNPRAKGHDICEDHLWQSRIGNFLALVGLAVMAWVVYHFCCR